MAYYVMTYDPTTGMKHSSGLTVSQVAGTFADYDFTVGPGGQTIFSLPGVITATSTVRVYSNGVGPLVAGAGNDYTVDTGLSTVTFLTTVPEGAWVRVSVM